MAEIATITRTVSAIALSVVGLSFALSGGTAGAGPFPIALPLRGAVPVAADLFDAERFGLLDGLTLAQTSPGDGGNGDGNSYEDRQPFEYPDAVATVGRTDSIVASIRKVGDTCGYYNPVLRVDCIRDQLNLIVQRMPSFGDYAELRQEISIAVGRLNAIVAANADPAAPAVRRRIKTPSGNRTSATPIRPIAPKNLAAANAQASVVLDQLSTRLLRSASSSAAQKVHYERAAQALDSVKVLLRST
ncbi:MAG: hypothetical protein U1D06_04950 [Paracoccaceae bacterium]|nr:hypothetical protein [Paracoccaceae bacterium]